MAGGKNCLDDYKASIKYEEGVFMELRRRKKAKNRLQNNAHLDWIFIKRIMATYRRGLKNFTTDYNFNLAYFEFLKYFPEEHRHVTNDHVKRMIQLFQHEPDIFRKAAAWFFQCDKIDEARNILLRGQSLHPQALEIYLDLIEIEIKNPTAKGIKERLKKYIDSIVKNNITYRFLEEAIKVFENYENLKEVIDYAIEQLLLKYRDEPGVWNFIALRELKGDYYPAGDEDKRSTMYSIERAILRFKEGISKLPKNKQSHLWKKYLDMLVDLQKEYRNPQTISFLRETLDEADAAKIEIEESHYLAWMDCCGKNKVLLVKKLEEGTKNHPKSVLLWALYLKHYVHQDEWEFAKQVFEKAIDALGPKSLKIWELFIDFHLLKSPDAELDGLYEKAISQPHAEIVMLFKPRFLAWIILSKGVEAARELYLRIANQAPYSKKLHEEMLIADEMDHLHATKTNFRKQILELWMQQFGAEDLDIYFQRIAYVKEIGDPDVNGKVAQVYEEAIRTLSDDKKVALFKKRFEQMEQS